MFSFAQPTYALLGYTPRPCTLPSLDDDVYSLAEEGVLYTHSEDIAPKPTRYRDIPVVYDTLEKAAADDPLYRYITDTPDAHKDTKLRKAIRMIMIVLSLIMSIYHGQAWSINHGESVITIIDPTARPPRGAKAIDTIITSIIRKLRDASSSKEQRARTTEFSTKFGEAVKKVLGEDVAQMYEVQSLATRPARQGRGYASTLVHIATSRADTNARRSFLGSSNTINRAFYASLGFEIVYTIEIGKENPSWEGKPIEVDLMVREVKRKETMDQNDEKKMVQVNEVLVVLD